MHSYLFLDMIMSGLVSNTCAKCVPCQHEMEILRNLIQVSKHLTHLLIHTLLQNHS